MGQCISLVPAGDTPTCKVCGKQASGEWKSLGFEERSQWVWEGKQVFCRKCVITEMLDHTRFENDRKKYAQAKEDIYPKPTEGVKPIRRLGSGEKWDSGRSFRSGWKPPSTLQRLMSAISHAQQEEPGRYVGPQRKGTGFVPASCPPAAPGTPLQQLQQPGAASADPQQQAQQGQQAHGREEVWASLEEEYGVEQVTEECIGLECPSVHGTSLDRQSAFPALEDVQEGQEEVDREEGEEEEEDMCEGQAAAAAAAGQPGLPPGHAHPQTPQLKSLQSTSKRMGEVGAGEADAAAGFQSDSAFLDGEEPSRCTAGTA